MWRLFCYSKINWQRRNRKPFSYAIWFQAWNNYQVKSKSTSASRQGDTGSNPIAAWKSCEVCPGLGILQPQWNPYQTLAPPSCWVRQVRSIGDPQYGLVKYGSEEKGSWFYRYFILLGFIMSKKQERLHSELLSEDKTINLLGFLT